MSIMPVWSENQSVNIEKFKNWLGLPLPDHCPSTLMMLSQNMVPEMYVAGGSCITIIDPMHSFTDIDIYAGTEKAHEHARMVLSSLGFRHLADRGSHVADYTDDLNKVQLIQAPGIFTIQHLLATFDLDVCKIGFDHKEVVVGISTVDAIRNKEIRHLTKNNNQILKITMHRLFKYAYKGYKVHRFVVDDLCDNLTVPSIGGITGSSGGVIAYGDGHGLTTTSSSVDIKF